MFSTNLLQQQQQLFYYKDYINRPGQNHPRTLVLAVDSQLAGKVEKDERCPFNIRDRSSSSNRLMVSLQFLTEQSNFDGAVGPEAR